MTHLGGVWPSLGLSFPKCKRKLRTPLWSCADCYSPTWIRRFRGGFSTPLSSLTQSWINRPLIFSLEPNILPFFGSSVYSSSLAITLSVFLCGMDVTYQGNPLCTRLKTRDCPSKLSKILLEVITGEAPSGYSVSWRRTFSLVNRDRMTGCGLST